MEMREFGEGALIAAFTEIYRSHAATSATGVIIGIGDDGAVTEPLLPYQAVTTDIASDGIHFNRQWSSGRDIGAKIAIANLADVVAMGGVPKYLLVALAVPADEEVEFLLEISRGIQEVASSNNVSVIGGDVIAGKNLTISITALGSLSTPVLRSGAKVGDCLFVTRAPGRSLAGLLLLSKEIESPNSDSLEVRTFQRPPFHPSDLTLLGFSNMNALMDISDGLLSDLPKIGGASGVALALDIDEKYLSHLSAVSDQLHISPLELFLRSGEEHSFIVAVSQKNLSKVPAEWIKIGEVVAGEGVTWRGGTLPFESKSWHW